MSFKLLDYQEIIDFAQLLCVWRRDCWFANTIRKSQDLIDTKFNEAFNRKLRLHVYVSINGETFHYVGKNARGKVVNFLSGMDNFIINLIPVGKKPSVFNCNDLDFCFIDGLVSIKPHENSVGFSAIIIPTHFVIENLERYASELFELVNNFPIFKLAFKDGFIKFKNKRDATSLLEIVLCDNFTSEIFTLYKSFPHSDWFLIYPVDDIKISLNKKLPNHFSSDFYLLNSKI